MNTTFSENEMDGFAGDSPDSIPCFLSNDDDSARDADLLPFTPAYAELSASSDLGSRYTSRLESPDPFGGDAA